MNTWTSEEIKSLESRAKAAEATVVELKLMLENFRIIIDSQAKALNEKAYNNFQIKEPPMKRGYDCTLDFECLCEECVKVRRAASKTVRP